MNAHPGAQQERAELWPDGTLVVWIRARPVEGRANAATERYLAGCLGLRPRQVVLVAGGRGRRKIVEIDVSSFEEVRARLLAHGARSR